MAAPGSLQDSSITGRFDPAALERVAALLKELDAASNARRAFESRKASEVAKLKDMQAEIDRLRTARSMHYNQRKSMAEVERRQTTAHQQEQSRLTADYRARLEEELHKIQLQDQTKLSAEELQLQQQQAARLQAARLQNDAALEELKRQTLEEQAKLDQGTAVATARAEAKGRIFHERENLQVRLRQMRTRLSEERATRLGQIGAIFSNLGEGSRALLSDRSKMATLVGCLTTLALGVYSARAVTRVAGNLAERVLLRPPLVRETSRRTWSHGLKLWRSATPNLLENIVLEEELADRLQWTANSLINAKRNGTPYRHLLLHGPPGTGKTLFARTLSMQSGLDYAIMSGGDVGPLGKDAVHELNKVFSWANSSRRGLILFIDEAEAFLRRGRGSGSGNMSEEARNVLSSFLHHTGTESDKFVVILATNIKEVLDGAVQDRIDDSFAFGLPGLKERRRMLEHFMEEHIHKPTRRGKVIEVDPALDGRFLDEVAARTSGFSGRQLAKLVVAYQAAVFGSGTTRLTLGLAETVLQYKLQNRREEVFLAGMDVECS